MDGANEAIRITIQQNKRGAMQASAESKCQNINAPMLRDIDTFEKRQETLRPTSRDEYSAGVSSWTENETAPVRTQFQGTLNISR